MPGLLLAQATSDNAPGGAYFSFWFPLGLFVLVAAILWVLYSRPHRRVPPRRPAHALAGGARSAPEEQPRAPRQQGGPEQPGGPGQPGGPDHG